MKAVLRVQLLVLSLLKAISPLPTSSSSDGSDVGVDADTDADSEPWTLQQCLDAFTKPESVEDYHGTCSNCKSTDISNRKQIHLGQIPVLLVVQLVRFQFASSILPSASSVFPSAGKIKDSVTCPVEFLNDHDLFAVLKHHGPSLQCGHYTALVRCVANGHWYNCNDSTISLTVPTSRDISTDGYLLFYSRKGMPAVEADCGVMKWRAAV